MRGWLVFAVLPLLEDPEVWLELVEFALALSDPFPVVYALDDILGYDI